MTADLIFPSGRDEKGRPSYTKIAGDDPSPNLSGIPLAVLGEVLETLSPFCAAPSELDIWAMHHAPEKDPA